jgi:hypothetical protein
MIIEEMEQRCSRSLKEAEFGEKSAPDSWSRKEVLGHLIDSALNNHRRFILAIDQDELVFEGYGQDVWVDRNGYQERPITEIFQTLILLNKQFNSLVKGMDFDFLMQKTVDHNFHEIGMNSIEKGISSSLSYFFWDYLFHLEHHLIQVFPGYSRKLKPQSSYKCV